MNPEERIEKLKSAFAEFMEKMSDIKKRQLILFDKVDKIVSKENADGIRKKINNN